MVYAFNWYDVGAVLPLIGRGLGAGTVALGVVLGSFLLGVGLFQIPAGIAAVRWGARRASLAGLIVLGVAGTVSGLAPTWESLAAIRFVAGVGAAFFFSPALSLIASYYPAGRRGPVIGLYNGGFSIGGTAGLFLGAEVGAWAGWPWALAAGGLALLGTAAVCWAVLPEPGREHPPSSAPALRATVVGVLRSRSLWALSLALTGFWGAIYMVAQYFVAYGGAAFPAWPAGLAAGLAALVVVLSFPSGPVGGWLGERGWDRRALLAFFGGLVGVLTLLLPFLSFVPLVFDLVALGLADGVVFAILYLVPTYLPETRGEGLALGVAFVNSVQVSLGSALAVAFGAIAAAAGYTSAWLFAGAATLALLPLLVGVRVERARPRPGPDGALVNSRRPG